MTHAWVKSFLFVIALICLVVIDHPPVTVKQNCDYSQTKPKK